MGHAVTSGSMSADGSAVDLDLWIKSAYFYFIVLLMVHDHGCMHVSYLAQNLFESKFTVN